MANRMSHNGGDRDIYIEAYRLTDRVTPVEGDCGLLCGKACCRQNDHGLGMYLLPGEEGMFSRREQWLVWEEHRVEDYDFPAGWSGTTFFVHCCGTCPREKRPLQCRTFPLAPHLTPAGNLVLIRETLALPYACPIIARDMPLRADFVDNVYLAWAGLLVDARIRELVEYDSRQRIRDGTTLRVVANQAAGNKVKPFIP